MLFSVAPELKEQQISPNRSRFELGKTAKPESSRQISIEQYVVGKGFRGAPP